MEKQKSPYIIRQLSSENNREMLEILQLSPIESGGLSICFDREPDIFTMANLKYKPAKYIGIFKDEQLLGFGSMGYYTGYVLGEPQTVFHLSNVFMRKEYRKKGLFLPSAEVFFEEAHKNSYLGYAVIMKGNKNAERYIGWQSERYPFIPYTSVLGVFDVRNIIISFKKRESKISVRKAKPEDLEQIVSLLKEEFSGRLFSPFIDSKVFMENLKCRPDFSINNYYVVEKENKIVGTCAAWDCSSFKQIRILKYSKRFRWIQNLYSLFSLLFSFPPLPVPGKEFKAVYITDYAVFNRDPKILNALLRKIYNEYRILKFNLMVFGSYENDNLLKATNGFVFQSVKSNIILCHKDKSTVENVISGKTHPYVDVAFL